MTWYGLDSVRIEIARVVEDAAVTLTVGQNASNGTRNAIRAGIARRENVFIW